LIWLQAHESSCRFRMVVLIQIKRLPAGHGLLDLGPSRVPRLSPAEFLCRMLPPTLRKSTCATAVC
jgi:hypothetical protein